MAEVIVTPVRQARRVHHYEDHSVTRSMGLKVVVQGHLPYVWGSDSIPGRDQAVGSNQSLAGLANVHQHAWPDLGRGSCHVPRGENQMAGRTRVEPGLTQESPGGYLRLATPLTGRSCWPQSAAVSCLRTPGPGLVP